MDRRRQVGPETSAKLIYDDVQATQEARPEEGTTPVRSDGRAWSDLRSHFVKTGIVQDANGSCYIEAGSTKLLCAVYGPHASAINTTPAAKLEVEVKFTPSTFPGSRRAPGKGTESASLSADIHQALLPSLLLDRIPRSTISVHVTLLQWDGPLTDISAGITAASLALASAKIEMRGLVIGTCAVIRQTEDASIVAIDPTADEVDLSVAQVSMACMPALGTLSLLEVSGKASLTQIDQAIERMTEASARMHSISATSLQTT
ncbi:uncharacterized protein L969DRAFT_94766 [Mixia osmundae IAM 14324]|uniref:Exoribonuclease phosphorolytic domain-containing protein n=1 Tax=Mixia osmundae (strain CBS 9802 / IAM 14324 / JCM 22182 / KY 12970) TaxID=764103 RepID=G7E465_MIXOS|nr:uncharacterized protein L969DRAFT_94766 [Mixia osmundae IAM 14324]KEI39721.1 hypothetical protein L969DRAFT_94766 [Mixia osmundae IAM 14324]GAA97625.1 hypothetical protein E5Q_04303 [Mixia osmundae IAM 14324]